jgi:large subunit ribosomal protein L35
MPKLKTNKSVAKRFKVSATGKIRYKRAGKSHLLTGKSRRRKRHLKQSATVTAVEAATIRKLFGGK